MAAKEPAADKTADASAAAKAEKEEREKHVYRVDLGEGLPQQKDTLNPDRAK